VANKEEEAETDSYFVGESWIERRHFALMLGAGSFLNTQRKAQQNIFRQIHIQGRDLKPALSEYEAGILTTPLRISIV
jgi:hypothetical protein